MDLGGSFNRTGIVGDSSTFSSTGGLDGGGAALSSNLLGTSQTWNGTPFTIGAAGSSDVVSATGQTIGLPAGQYASLQFLAAAVNGSQANQTFTVTYSDSTTATFTQSISDWYTPQNYSGESTAVTMSYRDRSNGTKDSRPFYVYGYSFRLDAAKTVSSITLPNDANVELLSATLSPAADATPPITPAVTQPTLLRLELVTNNALVNSDADNGWGGQKLRIIRMSNGDVYTCYSTGSASNPLHNQWNLAKRNSDGTWSVVATGMAGREPVNLLRGPQDQIYIVSWDNGLPSLTTSTNDVNFSTQAIPGNWENSNWPYHDAGIAPNGDLYVFQCSSTTKPSKYNIGYRQQSDGVWHFSVQNTDYRYTHPFVFPTTTRGLQVLGMRDVLWSNLGWVKPAGQTFDYVFDGLRQFRTTDIASQPFSNTLVAEDVQTAGHEYVTTRLRDAWLDGAGNTHFLYVRNGADTNYVPIAHTGIVDGSGHLIKDVAVSGGDNAQRYYQSSTNGTFYVLDGQGHVIPAGADGTVYGSPTTLNLQGYRVGYNGIFLAAPRGGTPQSNIVDGVFDSGGNNWVYIRVQLP